MKRAIIAAALLLASLGAALGQPVYPQNYFYAGPTSGSGFPKPRAVVAGDLPPISGLSGTLALSQFGNIAANSVLSNWTSGSANPAFNTWPACANDGSHALVYINGTGLQCETITATAAQLTLGGRVTLVSGTCVATTDQAAQTTVYYAPCGGGQYVPVYDGVSMALRQFTASTTDQVGLTLALGSNWAASTAFDLFITMNSGVVTPCTVAWSNSGAGTSTRATAVTQYTGVWVNNAAMTCRINNTTTIAVAQYQGTLVGGFRTNGSTGTVDLKFGTAATGGGAACICIWNVYNQVLASAFVGDTTASWNYTLAAYQQADASAGNQINVMQGLTGQPVELHVGAIAANNGTNSAIMNAGIGIDSTVSDSSSLNIPAVNVVTSKLIPANAYYTGALAVGYHNLNRLEQSQVASTSTWYGFASQFQTGIRGKVWY